MPAAPPPSSSNEWQKVSRSVCVPSTAVVWDEMRTRHEKEKQISAQRNTINRARCRRSDIGVTPVDLSVCQAWQERSCLQETADVMCVVYIYMSCMYHRYSEYVIDDGHRRGWLVGWVCRSMLSVGWLANNSGLIYYRWITVNKYSTSTRVLVLLVEY